MYIQQLIKSIVDAVDVLNLQRSSCSKPCLVTAL